MDILEKKHLQRMQLEARAKLLKEYPSQRKTETFDVLEEKQADILEEKMNRVTLSPRKGKIEERLYKVVPNYGADNLQVYYN